MQLYSVNKEYINHLYNKDNRICRYEISLGLIHVVNGFIYFIPIDYIDDTDYIHGELRKSTPTIFRMIENNTHKPLGKLLLSNMFPIPYREANRIISFHSKNIFYEKIIEYSKKNQKRIQIAVERLYKQKIREYQQPYLKQTLDFKQLEILCLKWEKENYGKHENRFPDSEYFIENPYLTGTTDYYLMNKKTIVVRLTLDNETQNVLDIKDVYNENYAPLECFEKGQLTSTGITSWFKGRGIPSWREGLDEFLYNSGITKEYTLLNRAFGLSLSDQYWMNPVDMEMDWDDINFFDHNFNSSDFIEASFDNRIIHKDSIDFFTPNNTSDGMLKKAWIVDKNVRYLLKGSYKEKGFEPFCEVLASDILDALDVEHVSYTIDYLHHIPVSKCACFIDKDTELVSAYSLLKYENMGYKDMSAKDIFDTYIYILDEHGIKDVRMTLAKMFICDYLIVNEDRHLGNFGIIRNVNDLSWIKIAPIYDSGQAMYSQKEVYEMNYHQAYGTFFHLKHMDFDKLLKIVLEDININVDKNKLIKALNKWKDLLLEHQYQAGISSERIDTCVEGLLLRIEKLFDILK